MTIASAPRTAPLLLDTAALARVRAAARAGTAVPGLAELRREADAAASAVPLAVTDKIVPAPSGDPHDYVSLSIYWWPDRSTPDGLPYLYRDGEIDPEASDTTRYDASRLNRMVGSVEALALVWEIEGEHRYADAAARWLRTWFLDERTRMRPSMRYAQVVPGQNEPRGTGIIDSRQLLRAIDAALLLSGTPSWTTRDDEALRGWSSALVDWLITSESGRLERHAKNNHGTWYEAQVVGLALYAGRAAEAREAVDRVRDERIPEQIMPDGRQPRELARTRSFHYSAFSLLAIAVAADLAPLVGLDLWRAGADRIRAAIDLLLRHADTTWPYADIERADPFVELAPILARAAHAYPDAPYAEALATLAAGAPAEARLRIELSAFGALGGTAAIPAPLKKVT